MATHTAMAQGSDATIRNSFEQRIGILHYISQKEHGWHGQIRTRFTDFQVHEISKDGEVVHLHDFQTNPRELPNAGTSRQPTTRPQVSQPSLSKENKKPGADNVSAVPTKTPESQNSAPSEQPKNGEISSAISESDRTALAELLGQDTVEELVDLYGKSNENTKAKAKDLGAVKIAAISDKAQRSRVHSEIRRVFGGKLDTATEGDGSIKATVVGRGKSQWGNRSRNDRPRNNRQNAGQGQDGNFLHFTLYKENRDTIEAISNIARILNLKPAFFGTAGTKDRRAVTAQRVSMRRRNPQTLVFLNNDRVYGVKIGDFKFEHYPIQLGHHSGNEFVIVVKNCYFSGTKDMNFEQKLDVAKATVDSALDQVKQNGFINYYGTQRFGTHQIGTQEIGMKILKGDFEGAVQALLSFDPELLDSSDPSSFAAMRREDSARARACALFLETGDAQDALKYLPKRCHVEATVMRHLSGRPKDFIGALSSISRGMRSMYGHAYQSLVWNYAASKRWEHSGLRVVKGDLVLVRSETSTSPGGSPQNGTEEETIHLVDGESITEDIRGLKAHALTEEEANSGKYSIFDIVLPSPGWDVLYPNNEIGQFYTDFMGKEENGGLDPHKMLRSQRDFSLPGSYRKFIGKFIGTPSASVRPYVNDTDQLVPTDLDLIRSRKAKEAAERAEARRGMNAASSGWQTFVDNVQENELQETLARVERRKAEESSDAPGIRAMDTWVQKSRDGSNKRAKISESANEATSKTGHGATQTGEGPIQASEATPETKEGNEDEDMIDQPDIGKGTESTKHDNAVPSVVTSLTSQIPENAALSEGQSEEPSSADATKDGKDEANQPADDMTATTSADPEVQDTIDSGKSVDKPVVSTGATTREHSAVQTSKPSSPYITGEKKIAVIIRFALNTSQYATIALRELQGAVATSEDTTAGADPSVSLGEDAVHSSQ
ncbi:pseudouridine synthase [Hypoxylon sp. NC1633]|nr:pseudouridine synthase [Hypoxylon sp. NC1633]